jgi:alanyl-tRNA synthetase
LPASFAADHEHRFSRKQTGPTARNTGEIGICKIVSEGSISAGVRRIEAVTGEGALHRYQETTDALRRLSDITHAGEPELVDHVEKLLAGSRALEKEVERLKNKLAQAAAGGLEAQARTMGAAKVLAARLDGMDRAQMRALADSLRNKWKSAVVFLASADDGGVSLVSAVTKDLAGKVHAGKLVGAVAQAIGGKGGGRPDMAEGGGKDAAALDAALENVYATVGKNL